MNLPLVTIKDLGITSVKLPAGNFWNAMERDVLVALVKLVSPKRFVEFGCNEGATARMLMRHVSTIETYIGIDAAFGYVTPHQRQRDEVPKNPGVLAANIPGFELILRKRGSYDVHAEELGTIDAALIDGDHSKEGVLNDTAIAQACVRSGGLIIWHDYYIFDAVPVLGVKPALDEMHAAGYPLFHVQGTWIAFMRVQ